MIELNIETANLEGLVRELRATESQFNAALSTTFRRLKGWLGRRMLPEMAQALNLQQKIIRRRLKFKSKGGQNQIWFGLNPVGYQYLKPKKAASGVTAYGGRQEDGAFIAKRKKTVFKRTGSERLPIRVVETSIYEDGIDYLQTNTIDTVAFEAEFYKIFERELRWRTR